MTSGLGPVELIDFAATRVAVLEHHGSEAALGASVARFIAWRRANQLPPPVHATFNVYHTHQIAEGNDHLHYDLCVATDQPIAPNAEGVIEKWLPAGRCARVRVTGHELKLADALHYLYAEWLPQSGQQRCDFPMFAQRIAFGPGVPAEDWIADLFLPLQ